MVKNLLYNSKFHNMIIQTTAGSTDLEGVQTLDMAGFDSVCFIGIIDTITTAGELQMYLRHSDSSTLASLVDCTGTCVGSTAASNTTDCDDKLLVLDIERPTRRYVSVHVDKSAQNSEIRVIAIQYNANKVPVTQSTDQYGVYDSDLDVSPTT